MFLMGLQVKPLPQLRASQLQRDAEQRSLSVNGYFQVDVTCKKGAIFYASQLVAQTVCQTQVCFGTWLRRLDGETDERLMELAIVKMDGVDGT